MRPPTSPTGSTAEPGPAGASALDWAAARLHELGTPLAGEPRQVKHRPWSTVHRLPITGGVVWLKACGGRTGYEAPLVAALAAWVPDLVVTPLATDDERGWLLLPDGGTPLREHPEGADPRVWQRFVAEHAGLQRAVAPRAEDLLKLGVPDQRPAALPALLERLLQDVPLASAERTALRRVVPRFADACAELGHAGPAATIQHDDLHAGNVLAGCDGARSDRFFDWGDAAVAHPFTTLLVTLRSMAATLDLAPDDPALRRTRDAYLEAWDLTGPGALRLARLAAWTGSVGRALAWQRALAGATEENACPWAGAVAGWLAQLLEPGPAWFGSTTDLR